jgi:hypothetical protein
MENIIKLFIRTLTGIFILSSISCGEESALKEETIYFQKENKNWITADSIGCNFILQDNNGISHSFTMLRDFYEFSKSWGSFLGINTDMTHTEYHYQSYSSNYGIPFSLSLTAGFKPFGDEIYIDLYGVGFAFDFKFETVSRVNTGFGIKSKLMTDKAYEQQGEEIFSEVEILDSYSTSFHEYDTVMFFQLQDFKDKWGDFTVNKIYMAKNIGLIKYEMNNGISFERK